MRTAQARQDLDAFAGRIAHDLNQGAALGDVITDVVEDLGALRAPRPECASSW